MGLYVLFPRGWLMGLLGWMCPKRRGLKPRWRGCLQETVRWPGVFVVFPVCFGVALHQPGLISSVLDTWHPHCAVPAPESGLSPGRGGLVWSP